MSQLVVEAQKNLLQRRKALVARFRNQENEEKELQSAQDADWIDRSVTREELNLLKVLTDSERQELSEIDGALGRIEAGTYGRCEQCGQALGNQRLRAIPEARFCLGCSAKATGARGQSHI